MFASAGAVPDANAVTIEDHGRSTHAPADHRGLGQRDTHEPTINGSGRDGFGKTV